MPPCTLLGVTLDVNTILTAHLYAQPPINGVQYKSSFIALLTDARGAADRDLATGQVESGKRSMSWLGAAAYLVLLDQVGTCFQIPGQPPTDHVTVIHAVRSFSQVGDEPTLQALYALRCALAHDYALFNDGSVKGKIRPLLRHAFNFTADTTSPLVKLPVRTWSGLYDMQNLPPKDEITVVNLRKVGDLAEVVVADLRRRHSTGALGIRLSPEEFHVRYGMRWRVV